MFENNIKYLIDNGYNTPQEDEIPFCEIRGRRSGNTTRIIDTTIQKLFEGKEVYLWEERDRAYENYSLQKSHTRRVLRRLRNEFWRVNFEVNPRLWKIRIAKDGPIEPGWELAKPTPEPEPELLGRMPIYRF